MGIESQLAAVRSLIESDPDAVGLIDRLTIVNRTYSDAGDGSQTASDATVASNVPCLREDASYSTTQMAGGQFSYVTDEFYVIASSATRNIKPDYLLLLAARGDMPARTFERPVVLEETFGPVVHLGAKLRL